MDQFDPQFLQPLTADGALESAVRRRGTLRVTRPEDHHFTLFQGIFDCAIGFTAARCMLCPQWCMAPQYHPSQLSGFWTQGHPDGLREPAMGAQIVADASPHVVRPRAGQDGPGTVLPFDPLDLTGNDVQGLVPADAFETRDAPVFAVTLAMRDRNPRASWGTGADRENRRSIWRQRHKGRGSSSGEE